MYCLVVGLLTEIPNGTSLHLHTSLHGTIHLSIHIHNYNMYNILAQVNTILYSSAMRKLTGKEQFRFLTSDTPNRAVYDFILNLKVGDKALIDKEDWKTKVPLSHTLHTYALFKGKYSCKTLLDKSGWWVQRIK